MFHVCLCYTGLSVPCSLVGICWKRAGLLALLCVMLSFVLFTFPYGVLGQMWYLIEPMPEFFLLLYFKCIYHNLVLYLLFLFQAVCASKSAKLIEIESQAEQIFIEGHLDAGSFSSSWCLWFMSRSPEKNTGWHLRQLKTQISLRIRTV